MALSVRVEETVCVAGASATTQIVEANTMDPTVNVTMTTVRSFRTNNVEVGLQSFSWKGLILWKLDKEVK